MSVFVSIEVKQNHVLKIVLKLPDRLRPQCTYTGYFTNGAELPLEVIQEAQLMLTTGAMRLASVEVNKHGTILGQLRLFAKHVTATTRHKSVSYRYVTFILAVCCSSDAIGYTFYAVI